MSVNFNDVRAGLKARIQELRGEYRAILVRRSERGGRLQMQLRDELRPVQAQLTRLVPLYRAYVALMQQSAGGKAEQAYQRRFQDLRWLICELVSGYQSSKSYVVDRNLGLHLVVPVPGLNPALWVTKSMSELRDQAVEKLNADRRETQANREKLNGARAKFLASLTDDQKAMLRDALSAAKLRGNQALTFQLGDIGQ